MDAGRKEIRIRDSVRYVSVNSPTTCYVWPPLHYIASLGLLAYETVIYVIWLLWASDLGFGSQDYEPGLWTFINAAFWDNSAVRPLSDLWRAYGVMERIGVWFLAFMHLLLTLVLAGGIGILFPVRLGKMRTRLLSDWLKIRLHLLTVSAALILIYILSGSGIVEDLNCVIPKCGCIVLYLVCSLLVIRNLMVEAQPIA